MEVYCTRPSCTKPENTIPDEYITARSGTEIRCANCGMPLILPGNFIPIEKLGNGGFGRTFTAKNLDFPYKIRVIKQLDPIITPGQILTQAMLNRIEKMFVREAIILDRLQHPQIPKFLAFFTMKVEEETGLIQEFFYLVQDYIEGKNLAQELDDRYPEKFPEDEVTNILKEILNILKYIHNYEGTNQYIYVHRDIKPANIIRCSTDGKLYLIDFGAVKQIAQGLAVETTSIVLDRRFAPPEQFDHAVVSPASDLYALATTCLCLLTGITDTRQLVWNSNWKSQVRLSDERFAKALDEMLRYEQEQRPQSAQEVLDILSAEPEADSPSIPTSEADLVFTQIPEEDLVAIQAHEPDLVTIEAPQANSLATPTSNPDPHPQVYWLRKFIDGVVRLPQRWRSIINFIFPFFLGMAIAVAVHPIITSKPPAAPPPPDAEYFSRGEEALIPDNNTSPECTTAYDYKKQGMVAFANKDFTQAENHFNRAKQQFKQAAQTIKCEVDPETVIYAYNAKVAKTPSNLSLPTIAVVIPGYSRNREIALEILRGVAQSLNADQPLFQVLIATENIDGNQINTTNTTKVATYMSKNKIPGDSDFNQSKILGVIGHYTSDKTWEAGKIYGADKLSETEKLVLISPTSTAIRKTDNTDRTKDLNQYVFRTASNDAIAVGDLVKYISDKAFGKTMIVYDPMDKYSNSLKREFDNYLVRNQVILSNQNCNLITEQPDICILKAKNKNVDAILLFTSRKTLHIARQIIQLGNQGFQILGGDVLYDQEILNLKEAANNMIIAVFSDAKNANTQFTQKAREIGWIKNISWRSMSSYDATQVFIKALSRNSNPTRLSIYEELKNPNFSALGATNAEVSFQTDGDRKLVKGVGVLVKVKEISPNQYGFELEQTPERNNP